MIQTNKNHQQRSDPYCTDFFNSSFHLIHGSGPGSGHGHGPNLVPCLQYLVGFAEIFFEECKLPFVAVEEELELSRLLKA